MTSVAAKPGTAAEPPLDHRCAHCGRPVRETVHTRSAYHVDYYELHTGPVEEATYRHGEEGPLQVYQRLLAPERVVTCVDCYRDPAVREAREQRYRPEAYETVAEVSA